MDLKYSHIDILVKDLDQSVAYFQHVLGFEAGALQVWERDGFHVEYKVLSNEWQRFILVRPISGSLKDILDERGDGTIYRFCFMTPDLMSAHRELVERGIQPVDEHGTAIGAHEMASPAGAPILWLPQVIGSLSIEFLQEPAELPG